MVTKLVSLLAAALFYVKTNRYEFTLMDAKMAKIPVWTEQDDHPLAARKALRLARARLAELVTDSKS